MQLSLHADFALRVLIYLGSHPDQTVSTQEMSNAYGISRNHLVRVVQTLARHGYVHVTLGRAGGATLARQPDAIRLGDVVRDAEPDMRLVECFDKHENTCPIAPVCGLKPLLRQAMETFLSSLNRHTLADLLDSGRREKLAAVFIRLRGV